MNIERTENPQTTAPGSAGGGFLHGVRVMLGVLIAMFGGLITLVFISLVASYILSRLGGGPRLVDLPGFILMWVIFGGAPLVLGVLLVRGGRGCGRVANRLFLGTLMLFLALGFDSRIGPKNWHSLFRREKVLKGQATDFSGTYVTPHLDTKLGPGTNVVWCGTFQLAWNEACSLAGGNLQLASPHLNSLVQHPMAAALNEHAFTKDSIDEASYVAVAGFVRDQVQEKILQAVKDKFHGAFKPRLVPSKALTPGANAFVAYACLWKQLSFPVPFERLEDSLAFAGTQVRAFGIGRGKSGHDDMYSQVQILDYQDENDFIIELKTVSAADRLLLAKIVPQGTLANAVSTVRQRIASGRSKPAGTNDVLIVPRINLDIVRKYSELEGSWLVPTALKTPPDLILLSAVQSIRFDMNEKGAELQSEAHIGFGCGKEMEPERPHIMIFNRPYLVLLERTGAPMPYFALWVDNPEVLVKW